MADEPDGVWTYYTGVADVPGMEDDFPDGPPTVVIKHRGLRLVLRFAPGDFAAEGDVQELRLLPDAEALRSKALRRFAPAAELYLAFARAHLRKWGPEGTPETRRENLAAAADALREIAGPGRGLTDEFYRTIATTYEALVAEGEPHPVKALSENNHVTISAASRWVKEARRRRYLPKKARG
jgi:hypothetical protein